ncbi:MAG: hypothetical protein KVP17_002489, partial [Porospora cf. gigantea B]
MDGTACLEKTPVALVAECPSACSKEGDQCFTTRTYSHTLQCPAGWTLDGGRCVVEEIVDCTDDRLPDEECGEHCYVDMQCSGGSCFTSKEAVEKTILEGRRFLAATTEGLDICNSKPCRAVKLTKQPDSSSLELVSKTCLRRMETDPEVFCEGPADVVFNGESCCMKVAVPPVMRCPVQQFGASDDECFRLRKRAPQYVCPAGFEKKCRGSSRSPLGCECAATEENQAERSCPEEAELYDDVCVVYEDPIAYCPELGAELMDDAYCVKTVREPVRLRTTITLECVGEQCFEKVRADFARKNLLPGDDVQRLSTGADPIVELEATFE